MAKTRSVRDLGVQSGLRWVGGLIFLLLLMFTGAEQGVSFDCSNYSVTFLDAAFDGTNTTFSYQVCSNGDPAISHWVMGLPTSCAGCSDVIAASHAYSCGTDPTTGLFGVKFDQGFRTPQCRDYWIKLRGYWPTGTITVAVKAGTGKCFYEVPGPACPPPGQPGITIEKSASPTTATVGDTITYTIVVRNSGNVALSGVTVTDSQLGLNVAVGTLASGASHTLTSSPTYVVRETDLPGPLVNTATARGSYGGQTVSDQDEASVTLYAEPGITIEKSASPTTATVGDTITYTIVVRNSGNVALSGVTVTDGKLGLNVAVGTLAAGASHTLSPSPTYVVRETDLPGPLVNTATARGSYGGQTVSDEDEATVTLIQVRLIVTPEMDTNEVGTLHTFTALLEHTTNGMLWQPLSGKTIDFAIVSGPGALSTSAVTTGADGKAAVVLTSSVAGMTEVQASFSGEVAGAAARASDSASKLWVSGSITITPGSATNEVGDPHMFLITASAQGAAPSFWDLNHTVAPTPGSANLSGPTVTSDGMSASWSLTINHPVPTVFTAAATVTMMFPSGTQIVRTTNGTTGSSGPATKTYVDARIRVSPLDSVNPVGTNHTVTALVEVNVGAGWVPAPNGTPVVFSLLDNTAGATFVSPSAPMTSDGQASVTVFAGNPGAVMIRAVAAPTIQGLVLHRETGSGGFNGPDASKNWIRTNEPPTAEWLNLVTCRNTPIAFNLRASDPDLRWANPDDHPLELAILGAPMHGALSGNLSAVTYSAPQSATLDVVYTPEPDFLGIDYFTYTVTDPFGEFDMGRVRINVVDCGEEIAGGAGALGPAIVINEVAWAGTAANANHEWIELYSSFEEPVDLTGWTLRWRQKQPVTVLERYLKTAELRGTIAPFGFYLMERHTDNVASDIKADLIYAEAGPVVISEIAWGGTAASSHDQWIELTNVTETPLDLSGWVLRWRLSRPTEPGDEVWKEVALAGMVPPFGIYLLERGSDQVVADVPANLIFTSDLDQRGDVLQLLDPQGLVVDTANVGRVGRGGWAAGYGLGGAAPRATMERVNLFAKDQEQNWHANTGLSTHGIDRMGDALTGTPGMVNEQFLLWGYPEVSPAELPGFLAYLPFVMDLSDRGEVLELVDPAGNVVSTANADRPDRDGWAAGHLLQGALAFAAMERRDPSLPDLDRYWDANEHIVINGLDADEVCLTATARLANEHLTMRYQTAQPVQSVRRGQILTVAVGGMPDLKATGCASHVALIAAETTAGGAGKTHAVPSKAWMLERIGLTDNYRIHIATAQLSPGLYYLWIATGDGRYRLIAFTVA